MRIILRINKIIKVIYFNICIFVCAYISYTVKAVCIDIPGDPKICQYIRLSLHMMKAWIILNYAHLIEYVLVLSNIKYMLSLISIISLIVYIT